MLTKAIYSEQFLVSYNARQGNGRGKLTIMAVRQSLYSKEEFAQRGDLIYQTQIRPQVEAGNHGKIVDIETGDFEVANSEILAVVFNHSLRLSCDSNQTFIGAKKWKH